MYKIQLCLTIPIVFAKPERSISALGKFYNFNRASMLHRTKCLQNAYLLCEVHSLLRMK